MTTSGDAPVLLVSPHLDDAVLSVGATIAALTAAGTRVVVGTVFAGVPEPPFSPVADAFHADCGLDGDAMAVRRREDLAALRVLGAEAVHLGFLDAVYRRTADGWLCRHPRAMFEAGLPAEPTLQGAIAETTGRLAETVAPQCLWTCAAIGAHVDHLLTRRAVSTAARARGVTLMHWEDLPYGFDHRLSARGALPPPVPVTAEHLGAKLTAIGCYGSQLPMLWPGTDWRRLVLEQAAARRCGGFELRWRADPAVLDRSHPHHWRRQDQPPVPA